MRKQRVLVVEDEAIIAESIKSALEEGGYEVCGLFDSGEGAVDFCREGGRCDLVLMDIHLAGRLSGIEAASEIQERFGAAVLFLTAYSDPKTFGAALLTRPLAYLVKPFNQRDLKMAVAVALDRRSLELELIRSRARFAAIVAATPDRIFSLGLDGVIRPEPESDLGAPEALMTPEVLPRLISSVKVALETGCAQRLDYEGEGARSFEARISPMVPDEGLVVVRDVTGPAPRRPSDEGR